MRKIAKRSLKFRDSVPLSACIHLCIAVNATDPWCVPPTPGKEWLRSGLDGLYGWRVG
jgi:hypothetical protein